jgi:transposase
VKQPGSGRRCPVGDTVHDGTPQVTAPADTKAQDNERAVKMLFEVREREGKGHGELARVARQLGVHPEALRSWVKQAEIDGGKRSGITTDDKKRIAELEKENRELRRANEILKAASAYFARELDPRLPR